MILTRHARGTKPPEDPRYEVVVAKSHKSDAEVHERVKANGWWIVSAAYVWGFNGSTTYTIYKPNIKYDPASKV